MRIAGSEFFFEADPELKVIADEALSNFAFADGARSDREAIGADAEFPNFDVFSLAASEIGSLGPELIASSFYDSIGIAYQLLGSGLDQVEARTAQAVICARLVAPGSDLGTHRWLGTNSALSELVGCNFAKVGKDAIYEIAYAIYEAKEGIEAALIKNENQLFPTKKRLFLFDLTNAYFEGRILGNDLA